MVKKLTSDDWSEIQKQAPSRYYVQSVADGKLRVTFDTEVVLVEKGEEDLLGNIWEGGNNPAKPWDKCEAMAFINGEPKIYSLGGKGWGQMNGFIACCNLNGVPPEEVPGSMFDIEKVGDFDYTFEYVGKGDGSKPGELKLSDDKLSELKEVIGDIKKNSPDLLKDSEKKADFLKLLYIRSKIKPSESEKYISKLEEDGIVKTDGDAITVL